jgi:hypothetical protein
LTNSNYPEIISPGDTMIPIKNFRNKNKFLAKNASVLSKEATLIKNFKMPFVKVLSSKKKRKK